MKRFLSVAAVMFLTVAADAQEATDKVAVGKTAPDFAVTGIDGKIFKLSEKTKEGKNVALIFSRANW